MLAAPLVALSAMACDQSPTASEQAFPDASFNFSRGRKATMRVVNHVSVGSADVCEAFGLDTGCDANLSLTATEYADGTVRGIYQDRFGGGGDGVHAIINCLRVVGNEAWVSGIVTNGFRAGRTLNQRVVDNGTTANDAPDQVSGSSTRLDATCEDQPDKRLFDLKNGQVKIRSAPIVLQPTQSCSDYAASSLVTFEDPNLEAVVRSGLGLSDEDDLSCELAGSLTALFAEFSSIVSIAGAQNLTGLSHVELDNNSISDIGPLSGLTSIGHLRLEGNQISDIGPLSGLTDIWNFLDLSANLISDLGPLSALTRVEELFLGENLIEDISPLEGLVALRVLGLRSNTNLSNIQPLVNNTGLGAGDTVDLVDVNPAISCTAVTDLRNRGVTVFSGTCP